MTVDEALDAYSSVHGLRSWEMQEIVHELGRLPHGVLVILEIGNYQGDSLRIWRAACPDALLLGVEIEDTTRVRDRLDSAADETGAQIIFGSSGWHSVYGRVVEALQGKRLDFLFIDGDHTLDAVRMDWNLYEPLVRPGGLIVLHDAVITWNESVEVHRFWPEVAEGRRTKLLFAGTHPSDPYSPSTGAGLVFKVDA